MKKSDIATRIQEIGKCTDDGERLTLLTSFQTDLNADYDALETSLTEIDTLNKKVRSLQDSNMSLFLQVSKGNEPADQPADNTQTVPNLNYDDLFNEKGELK